MDEARRRVVPGEEKPPKATLDDLLLISFSGHGYANGNGNFYFMPADIRPKRERVVTDDLLKHCISSDELSHWLRDVDAGEMTMIIDACHSAATFEGGGFKPGTMDSRGMGQLAYNKEMRILASSQSDNVALESQLLRQGLLTYALFNEGVESGKADEKPKDGRILLDECLRFGVERVPSLYEDVSRGKLAVGKSIGFVFEDDAPPKSVGQQPALFDFRRKRQDVVSVPKTGS